MSHQRISQKHDPGRRDEDRESAQGERLDPKVLRDQRNGTGRRWGRGQDPDPDQNVTIAPGRGGGRAVGEKSNVEIEVVANLREGEGGARLGVHGEGLPQANL